MEGFPEEGRSVNQTLLNRIQKQVILGVPAPESEPADQAAFRAEIAKEFQATSAKGIMLTFPCEWDDEQADLANAGGFFGHDGRPGQRGGSLPRGDAELKPRVIVPVGTAPPGTTSAEMNGKGIKQPSGAPVRGTVIDIDDPKIPDTLYHFTTHARAVEHEGILRARGKGGLGGDSHDQVVSMTTDPEIADSLKNDMQFAARYGKAMMVNPPPPREWNEETKKWEGDRTEWCRNVVSPLLKEKAKQDGWEYDPMTNAVLAPQEYGPRDHMMSYFSAREYRNHDMGDPKPIPAKFRDPLIYADIPDLAKLNPDDIKVVKIPKENLRTGSLLTDFDLDNSFGLKEIRSYGDVQIRTKHG